MNNIYYLKVAVQGAGLTNQLFCLITGIIVSYMQNKHCVIVDGFSTDYMHTHIENLSSIFNLEKMNAFLAKYDIVIFDKTDVDLKITKAIYGKDILVNDLTHHINTYFYKNNILYINKNTNLNQYLGDPCAGTKKTLRLHCLLNNYEFIEQFEENSEKMSQDIVFDKENSTYAYESGWINSYDTKMFDDIISNIAFHETYVKIASDFIQTHVSHNIPINIIHLRLEDDAINHWCVMNSLPKVYYKIFIENKYIELIKTHLNKSDNNIIVTYDNDNAVINYMKEHHYNPIFIDKSFEGRERNAIVDFLISKHCNNIFIGNFHFDNLNGSSFSYLIMKNISENVKKICIDLDNIMDTEHIYYKV